MLTLILLLLRIIILVQAYLSLGTAYRLTKNGGDDGVALFGWLFILGFASAIPGLGIYLWYKYRDL